MTPEAVLEATLTMSSEEFNAIVDTMSEEEAEETAASLAKVNMFMVMSELFGAGNPKSFKFLAEQMGFRSEKIDAILDGLKDGLCLSRHNHQCKECKIVFQHDPRKVKDEKAAHMCPTEGCKTEVTKLYHGNKKPKVLHHGE